MAKKNSLPAAIIETADDMLRTGVMSPDTHEKIASRHSGARRPASPSHSSFEFRPDYAVIPGETLLETLEVRGISQAELASRMGCDEKIIRGVIQGKERITEELALKLESAVHVPASLWMNLEKNYRRDLARQAER